MADEPQDPSGPPPGPYGAPGWGGPPPGSGPPPGYQQPPPGYGYPPPGYPPQGWGYPQQNWGYTQPPRTSDRAGWVLGLGIGSIVIMFTCGIGFIAAIISLCLAPGAKREIAESRGALTGDGMVKAGVICSWVTIGLTVLAFVSLVVILATFDSAWEID